MSRRSPAHLHQPQRQILRSSVFYPNVLGLAYRVLPVYRITVLLPRKIVDADIEDHQRKP